MDGFKLVLVVVLLVSLAALGITVLIAEDAINHAKIPDVERGLVTSKAPVSDGHPANYTVNLSDNRVLYILDNSALYGSIVENQSYLFDCRIDFNNKITLIDNATLIDTANP